MDIFFHHFNETIFSKLINDNVGDYHYYVIMPANLTNTNEDIKKLPKDKVYILDQIHEDLLEYAAIYQNFEKAIFSNLTKAWDLIKKYEKIILIFSEDKQPQGMLKGFNTFCKKNKIPFEIINSLTNRVLKKGELYVMPDDKKLTSNYKKNEKVIIYHWQKILALSHTMTPYLKKIVEGGITTISTDFNMMGTTFSRNDT